MQFATTKKMYSIIGYNAVGKHMYTVFNSHSAIAAMNAAKEWGYIAPMVEEIDQYNPESAFYKCTNKAAIELVQQNQIVSMIKGMEDYARDAAKRNANRAYAGGFVTY